MPASWTLIGETARQRAREDGRAGKSLEEIQRERAPRRTGRFAREPAPAEADSALTR